MTPRTTKRQRLEAAGWRHISGWVPLDAVVTQQAVGVPFYEIAHMVLTLNEAEAERIAETRKPSGRPKKDTPPP